jgi:hypothetical protein
VPSALSLLQRVPPRVARRCAAASTRWLVGPTSRTMVCCGPVRTYGLSTHSGVRTVRSRASLSLQTNSAQLSYAMVALHALVRRVDFVRSDPAAAVALHDRCAQLQLGRQPSLALHSRLGLEQRLQHVQMSTVGSAPVSRLIGTNGSRPPRLDARFRTRAAYKIPSRNRRRRARRAP